MLNKLVRCDSYPIRNYQWPTDRPSIVLDASASKNCKFSQAKTLSTTSTTSKTKTEREEGPATPTSAPISSHRLRRRVSENIPVAICSDLPSKSPKGQIPFTKPSSYSRVQDSCTSSSISSSLCYLLLMTESIFETFYCSIHALALMCTTSNPHAITFPTNQMAAEQGRLETWVCLDKFASCVRWRIAIPKR